MSCLPEKFRGNKLKRWQYQEKVPLKEFEEAYAVICRADLAAWAKMDIDELWAAVTGEAVE